MSRTIPILGGKVLGLLLVAGAIGATLASPLRAEPRHHISFGLGYAKHLSNDMKWDEMQIDFTNAVHVGLAYRYSINSRFDLTLDSEGTMASDEALGASLSMTNTYGGPGIRFYPTSGPVRPFVQANAYLVSEQFSIEENGSTLSSSWNGGGFGFSAGIDLRATPLLSFPVKVQYLYGNPADNVSSFGGNIAIAFNFGSEL